MSKLYDKYVFLKNTENNSNNTLYIFKSGLFFIFLDNDAKVASKLLNLKITHFTENVVKCGFPSNSLHKYTTLLKASPYNFKIIDTLKNTAFTVNDYTLDKKLENLLSEISTIDINTLSIREAYNFIEKIKESAKSIIGGSINGTK